MYTAHVLISDHPYGAHMLVSQKFILPQKKKRYESIKRIDSNFSDGRAAQSALSTVITVAGILGQVLGQTFQTMISFHCRKNIGSLFGR